jgi:hypothetical protein
MNTCLWAGNMELALLFTLVVALVVKRSSVLSLKRKKK